LLLTVRLKIAVQAYREHYANALQGAHCAKGSKVWGRKLEV
jgi:hypothetical protein